jgi:hypothetical protein
MKRLISVLSMLLLLMACGGGGSNSGDDSGVRTLTANEQVAGEIASEGDVDWYSYQVTAPDTMVQVSCTSSTLRPDVDLLMTVYEEDDAGNKQRLFATHAPDGSELPADLQINLFIDTPKEIFIAVRDLQDNDASETETYYVKVAEAVANEGNETFAQAESLRIDDETTCLDDNIGTVGDTDCFTFDVIQDGVYVAKVDFNRFNGGTTVNLAVELYDDQGNQLARMTEGQGEQYYLQHHLEAGTYYLLVEDNGQDDADASSNFHVCVESVSGVTEYGDNDTRDTAQTLSTDVAGSYTVSGFLDYEGDVDWYRLPIGATGTSGLKIMQVSFDDGSDPIMFEYRMGIEDGGAPATALLSHDFTGGSDAYLTQVKAGEGDHYLFIQAAPGQNANQSAPYTATITVVDVDDPAETDGDGNDSVDAADTIAAGGGTVTGKVSYRGDDDWYRISVDLSTPKVLSVDLTTTPGAEEPHVEYYLSVMRDSNVKKTYDANGEDGATHLKTSVWVPEGSGTATYLIKVSDYQGNEGDLFDYTLVVAVDEIPDSAPAGPPETAGATYFDEKAEVTSGTAVDVELENTALDQPHFQADTVLFDLSTATQTANGDGTTTVEFPWVSGFIDYEGDQDWFQLQLDKLNDADNDWYYDVDVQVVATGASEVEFVWKLYRDPNGNGLMVDRPTASDGYVGAIGDSDPVDTTAFSVDTTTMTTEGDLWIGDGWGAGDYYISMSDFNYVRIRNEDGSSYENTEPDADWSLAAAYYFKVTLVYHPGVSNPD